MTARIHKMTNAELDAAIVEAEAAYDRASTDTPEHDKAAERVNALLDEQDARAEQLPHDEHVGLDVPAGYAS